MANMCGQWSETRDATESVQCICDEVKCQVGAKTNKRYVILKAVKYRSQREIGMDYLIKVRAELERQSTDYLHVRVFKNFPCNGGKAVVNSVKEGHKICDPLVP